MATQRNYESYVHFIYKVLKQVSLEASISKRAISIVNEFMVDMFERLCIELGVLVRFQTKSTLTARDVQTSVQLVFPGELATDAVAEGVMAVEKYVNYKNRARLSRSFKQVSPTVRAGLVFPVGRIRRFMRQRRLSVRLSIGASYYMTAVLEFLCAKILVTAENVVYDNGRKRIIPRYIQLAIRNDNELNKLFGAVMIKY